MTKATPERSYIPGRDVRPLVMQKADNYRSLSKIGICMDSSDVQAMMIAQRHYAMASAMDAAPQALLTTASIATPVQFLQNWLPGFVKIMTAARKIDEFIGISTSGSWEQEEAVQGVMENTGLAIPYGDYTNVPLSSWNVNFVKRTIVRFEEGMKVGPLEERRAAAMRVNSAEQKREAAGLALEIQRNLVGFNGYNSGNGLTYGFLNDPGLPNYVNVAAGASGSLLWARKTYLEITSDIRTAIVTLRTQSQDTIDPETTPMTLALPTNAVDYLSVNSNFGASTSVRQWIKETYPNIRVVSAPQLNAANGGVGVFYLYADSVQDMSSDDGRTWAQIVPAKFQVIGVAKLAKGFEEDYSNASAGVMLKRPYAVTRFSGIS